MLCLGRLSLAPLSPLSLSPAPLLFPLSFSLARVLAVPWGCLWVPCSVVLPSLLCVSVAVLSPCPCLAASLSCGPVLSPRRLASQCLRPLACACACARAGAIALASARAKTLALPLCCAGCAMTLAVLRMLMLLVWMLRYAMVRTCC